MPQEARFCLVAKQRRLILVLDAIHVLRAMSLCMPRGRCSRALVQTVHRARATLSTARQLAVQAMV